jgi:hypothetical protein
LTCFIPLKRYYIGVDDDSVMIPIVSADETVWFAERKITPKLKWMKEEKSQKYNYHLEFEEDVLAVEYVLVWG